MSERSNRLYGCINTYAYVGGNPVSYVDQYGLQAIPLPINPGGAATGGGTWWSGQKKPRDSSGISDDLFPEAKRKPSIKWPEWLKPWVKNESAEETKPEQCPVPVPSEPTQPPGKGWEWRGKGKPGSDKGSWYNPGTNESMHPDLNHPPPIGPHWDYTDSTGKQWRVDPATETMWPK